MTPKVIDCKFATMMSRRELLIKETRYSERCKKLNSRSFCTIALVVVIIPVMNFALHRCENKIAEKKTCIEKCDCISFSVRYPNCCCYNGSRLTEWQPLPLFSPWYHLQRLGISACKWPWLWHIARPLGGHLLASLLIIIISNAW